MCISEVLNTKVLRGADFLLTQPEDVFAYKCTSIMQPGAVFLQELDRIVDSVDFTAVFLCCVLRVFSLPLLLCLISPFPSKAAVPVEGRCAWTAEFRPSIEGVYTFDATLIDWGGDLDPHREM